MSMLEILKNNKKAILAAELGAFLHDLDKLHPDFYKNLNNQSKEESQNNSFNHTDGSKIKIKVLEQIGLMDRLKSIPVTLEKEGINPIISINKETGYEFTLLFPATIDVNDAFIYHHDKEDEPKSLLTYLTSAGLGGCDGIDSELDKNNARSEQKGIFYIDSPFGYNDFGIENDPIDSTKEKTGKCIPNFDGAVAVIKKYISQFLDKPDKTRHNILKELKPIYSRGLGETRYPCNDVTLWAHSYSVASMTKALLAKVLLETSLPSCSATTNYKLPVRSHSYKEKEESEKHWTNKNYTDFTFMKVTFDREYLWSTAVKVGDIMGMAARVTCLQKRLKRFVETELLVGNESYRDQERQLFLIPQLGTWFDEKGESIFPENIQENFENTLKTKIKQFITRELSANESRGDEKIFEFCELPFAVTFVTKDDDKTSYKELDGVTKRLLSRSKSLLNTTAICKQEALYLTQETVTGKGRCDVCRIRYANQSAQREHLCIACHYRRHESREPSVKHLTSELESLIPKKSNESRLALIYMGFNLTPLYTGTIFDKVCWNGKGKKNPSAGRLYRSWEVLQEFLEYCRDRIAGEDKLRNRTENRETEKENPIVFPITSMRSTPERMEFVIRGSRASKVMTAIYDEYEKRFGKFRDCLPFSIGCIYFYKKFPLYVVMETARGMRKTFMNTPANKTNNGSDMKTYRVQKKINDNPQFTTLYLSEVDSNLSRIMNKGMPASWVEWEIYNKRSNDKLRKNDNFHCQFKCLKDPKNESNTPSTKKDEAYTSEALTKIGKEHTILVQEGFFDFILAESAQTRNAFSSKGRAHHILGERPSYPVGTVRDFDRLWKLLTTLHISQVSAIEGLLVEKMLLWREKWWEDPETSKAFCRLVLFSPNAFGKLNKKNESDADNSDEAVLLRAAWNGLLLDVIDLYKHLENK